MWTRSAPGQGRAPYSARQEAQPALLSGGRAEDNGVNKATSPERGVDQEPAPRRRAWRSAPHRVTASARPANFARNSPSVRKFAGSPFGTTTLRTWSWPRARISQLAGHVGGELGLDLGVEVRVDPRQQARTLVSLSNR